MAIITFRSRAEAGNRVLYTGDHADAAAALTHCAANGIDLTRANLAGQTFDGADISGLIAPKSDCTGASFRGVVANRAVNGRIAEFSASLMQGSVWTSAALTHINLACTQITAFRCETGARTNLRGVNWDACPDVIVLPTPREERANHGKCVAMRNGTGWKIHANARGVVPDAQVDATLGSIPAYDEARAYLRSAECIAAKAAIEARPVGSGEVVKPRADGDSKLDGAEVTRR